MPLLPQVVSLTVELPVPTTAPDEVRRIVADVLARPEYAELTPSVGSRIREWITEQLGRLLEAVLGAGQASLIGSLLLVLAVAVAVLLAARFTRALRLDPEMAALTAERVGRDPADWTAEADEHQRTGHHREALRCRYRAMIAVLATAGVVDEAPGRTAGEYLAEAGHRRADVVAHVAAVTVAFEAVWYGHARVDAATLDEVRGRVQAVHDIVTARHAVAGNAGSGKRQ